MKKLLSFAILLTIVLIDTSCKKGSEDPFISLRSRTARLCGKWSVNEGFFDNKSNWSEIYSPGNKISSKKENVTNTGTFTWNYEINNDGSYEMTKIVNVNNQPKQENIEKGIWYFLGANKEANIKDKQYVAFQPKEQIENQTDFTTETSAMCYVYEIVELRNNKIKLKKDYSNKYSEVMGQITSEIQVEITLIPQK